MNLENILDRFVTALESNRSELLDDILDDDVVLDSSALGIIKGKENVIEAFRWKGMECSYNKTRIFNNVLREKGNLAYQTFFSVLFMGKEENDFLNIFQCCFMNVLRYKDQKIISIKSQMTFECGNTLIVSSWWKLIDYALVGGNEREIINGFKDNPWLNIPDADNVKTDEEQIRQCFNRYCFAIDFFAYEDLRNNATSRCDFPKPIGNEDLEGWIKGLKEKRDRTVNFHGHIYPREAVWNHISSFKKLDINGRRAHAEIYRFEPNRIGTRFQHKYNIDTLYFGMYWDMNFIKDENETWRMDIMNFVSGGPYQVDVDDNKRYF